MKPRLAARQWRVGSWEPSWLPVRKERGDATADGAILPSLTRESATLAYLERSSNIARTFRLEFGATRRGETTGEM